MPRYGKDPFEALERDEAEIAELRRRLDDAAAANGSTHAVLAEVMGSNSWRLTAPLRRLRPRRRSRDA